MRHDGGTYTKMMKFGNSEFGSDDYVPGLRDWLKNGAESAYAMKPEATSAKLSRRTSDVALAEPNFKLGVHFHQSGDKGRANKYWKRAQELNPDSWNFHRQDWSFLEDRSQTNRNFMSKFIALDGEPYYEPLDLPEP